MPPKTEQIDCPRFPDHGPAFKRWLPPEARETITEKPASDVFEIDCPVCGKYEVADTQHRVIAS
jgi:hypothetical protein